MKSSIRLRRSNFTIQSIFLTFISFFGLFFLVVMFLWAPQGNVYNFMGQTVILSVFIFICISGILAAIYPSTCKTLMKFQESSNVKIFHEKTVSNGNVYNEKIISNEKTVFSENIQFEGHHPDCGKFSSHTLIINGKKYCPGCLGLSLGAVIAIVGTAFYYFFGCPLFYGEISFWVGFCTVFLALFLIVFMDSGKKLKIISNLVLVIGSFLILLGLDSVKGNLIIELYFIILVIFWILTRIMVSETSHEIVCHDCLRKSVCIYD